MAIKDFTVDNNIDVPALTETWLHNDDSDMVDMGTLCASRSRCRRHEVLYAGVRQDNKNETYHQSTIF